MRIVVDAMGSDNYPMPEIEGATLAAREFACEVILTGDETVIRSALDSFDVREVTKRLHIVHATQRVEMDQPGADVLVAPVTGLWLYQAVGPQMPFILNTIVAALGAGLALLHPRIRAVVQIAVHEPAPKDPV